MPKRKFQKMNKDDGGRKKQTRGRKKRSEDASYSLVDKRNAAFEKFYKEQHIVPDDEWSTFMSTLRENLAATFRITGTRSHAKQVSQCLETIFFKKMEGLKVDGEEVSPPRPLSWYPDRLAWHVSLPRKVIRKHPTLANFHQFLVHETEKGNLSRQEAVSMIPPLLMDVKPHHKLLDMCAAPGSKTAQLLELLHAEDTLPNGFVIANDKDHRRCYILLHQTNRINSPCLMVTNHDASVFPTMYHQPEDCTMRQPVVYDRVLCDVPCSGDGTMRKNIIMWKKWNASIGPGLHRVQLRILCRGIEVLCPGGRLVYSTCSLNPVENEAVVASLLIMSKGAVELVDVSNDLPGLISCPGLQKWKLLSKRGEWFSTHEQVPEALKQGLCTTMFPPALETLQELHLERCRRILPHHQDTGGFFIAVFHKLTNVPWQRKFPSIQAPASQTAQTESSESGVDSQLNALSTPYQIVDDSCSKDLETETTLSTDVTKPENICENDEPQASSDCGNTTGSNEVTDGVSVVSESVKAGASDACEEVSNIPVMMKDVTEGAEKKEEPFIFLTEDDPDWPNLREYYGLKSLPVDLLLVRSHTVKKRKIYIVSRAVKELVLNQKQHIRIVNLGVRVFQRSEGRDVNCPLRLASEGLSALLPYLQKRRIYVTLSDMEILLRQFNPSSSLLSGYARSQLNSLITGSVVFTYDPFREDTKSELESVIATGIGPECIVDVCGWVGGSSARIMSNDADRMHYLLILGLAREDDIKLEQKPQKSSTESSTERTVEFEEQGLNESDGGEEQTAGKVEILTADVECSDSQRT